MIAVLAFIVSSCDKEMQEDAQLQQAIRLSVDVPSTKATIFDTPASLTNPAVGGGDFAVSAWITGETSNAGNLYMNNVRVNYFSDKNDWRFTDANGTYVNFYWPLEDKLDFFGHFPLNPADGAVTSVTYDPKNNHAVGPSFEFELPLTSAGQEGLHEFLYSFVQNKDKSTPKVEMSFSHPYAAISFNLGQSYRMELNDIKLTKLHYKGTYLFDLEDKEWGLIPGDSKETLDIAIKKDIPEDINFNSPIGGPYLVAPHDLTDASYLKVSYTRLDGGSDTKSVKLVDIGIAKWEAGKHYVYTLNMGNTEEEILFKVTVENWKTIDHKNDIDVE